MYADKRVVIVWFIQSVENPLLGAIFCSQGKPGPALIPLLSVGAHVNETGGMRGGRVLRSRCEKGCRIVDYHLVDVYLDGVSVNDRKGDEK